MPMSLIDAAIRVAALGWLCFCFLCIQGGSVAMAGCKGGLYRPPKAASFDELNKTHLGSLLVLEWQGSPIGVSFLIDQRSGLFFTAAHVIADALKEKGEAACARNSKGRTARRASGCS